MKNPLDCKHCHGHGQIWVGGDSEDEDSPINWADCPVCAHPSDENRGLYNKYIIQKRDGTPIAPEAQYFVLRVDRDPAAAVAMAAYASAAEATNRVFADDLRTWLKRLGWGLHADRPWTLRRFVEALTTIRDKAALHVHEETAVNPTDAAYIRDVAAAALRDGLGKRGDQQPDRPAPRRDLYRRVDVSSGKAEPVQYVGVYVLKARHIPADLVECGFVEYDPDEEIA